MMNQYSITRSDDRHRDHLYAAPISKYRRLLLSFASSPANGVTSDLAVVVCNLVEWLVVSSRGLMLTSHLAHVSSRIVEWLVVSSEGRS